MYDISVYNISVLYKCMINVFTRRNVSVYDRVVCEAKVYNVSIYCKYIM